jgi:hypothetical protein
VLRTIWARRTWLEAAYVALGLPFGIAAFTVVVLGLSLGGARSPPGCTGPVVSSSRPASGSAWSRWSSPPVVTHAVARAELAMVRGLLSSSGGELQRCGGGDRARHAGSGRGLVVGGCGTGEVAVVVPRDPAPYDVDATSSAGSVDVRVRTDPLSARRIDAHSSAGPVTVAYDS